MNSTINQRPKRPNYPSLPRPELADSKGEPLAGSRGRAPGVAYFPSVLGPFDLRDACGAAQAGDDLVEVPGVADFDIDEGFEEILLAVDNF